MSNWRMLVRQTGNSPCETQWKSLIDLAQQVPEASGGHLKDSPTSISTFKRIICDSILKGSVLKACRPRLTGIRSNQLLRNLESARIDAGDAPFACLFIAEEPLSEPDPSIVERSLPHLDPAARSTLFRHYLGTISWREACLAVELDCAAMPNSLQTALRVRRRLELHV